MAQALGKDDSSETVVRAVRRHLRLSKRTGNAQALALAERIIVPRDALSVALKAKALKDDVVEDAFDDWVMDDRTLDRSVTSLGRKAEDWDEDHPPAATKKLLFADRTVTQVVRAPRNDEPDLVAKIVESGAKLPPKHPGAPLIPALTAQAKASRDGERTWIDKGQAASATDAAVEIARLAVVGAYKDNIIDIGRACGDAVMEDCFPALRKHAAAATEEAGGKTD